MLLANGVLHADTRYILQKGDTLYKISKEYDISLQTLIDNNNITDIHTMQVGDVILIPRNTNTAVHETNNSVKNTFQYYTVIKGDTLFKISKRFNVKISTLIEMNVLNSEVLYVNQKLKIPIDVKSTSEIIVNVGIKDKETYVSNKETISKAVLSFVDLLALVVNAKKNASRYVSNNWPIAGQLYDTKGSFPGVVIEGNEGTVVNALKGGQVMYASLHSSFNNVVVIKGADGLIYLYGGQKQLYVKQGEQVEEGQKIGELGIMPTVKKAILYFGIWQNNHYIDPNSILG